MVKCYNNSSIKYLGGDATDYVRVGRLSKFKGKTTEMESGEQKEKE